MLNEQDIHQLEGKGITREVFLQQIAHFKKGFPALKLDRPATANDGIRVLDERNVSEYVDIYNKRSGDYSVLKFVPASGAATRMFKEVFAWRDLLIAGVDPESLKDSKPEAKRFFEEMHKFPFWEDLQVAMDKDDLDADHLLQTGNYLPILEYLLFDSGLDYAALPKALIAFHRYDQANRTAMEEHLVEGAKYARGATGRVEMHFTLSPEHIAAFKLKLEKVKNQYEQQHGVHYAVSWSIQKPSTDTIAVTLDNLPFREKDGSLLFRPGGHGALIENLNDLASDLIFIKNIDNIVPDRLKETTIKYKKVLGGILIQLKEEIAFWMKQLDAGKLGPDAYIQALDFATNGLNIDRRLFPDDEGQGSQVLRMALDKPLRVCGMVRNQGEPGGGPFWVSDPETGRLSLQIVEKSQIDLKDPAQEQLLKKSTHFNPVDIACSFKNYKGEPYHLPDFIDPDTGFISHKSKDGQDLKALERPGLWNGAMAYWNTVFVEVPLITFNPVKTINDLLREEHQQM